MFALAVKMLIIQKRNKFCMKMNMRKIKKQRKDLIKVRHIYVHEGKIDLFNMRLKIYDESIEFGNDRISRM